MKEKNHVTVSVVIENTTGKIQHSYMIKTQKTMKGGEHTQLDKDLIQKNLQLTYFMVKD